MPDPNRGRIRLSQIKTTDLSGTTFAEEFATTVAGAKTAGDVAAWDANGNLTDGGTPVFPDLLVDSDGDIVVTSDGEVIYVL